jgi:hypothetical protein
MSWPGIAWPGESATSQQWRNTCAAARAGTATRARTPRLSTTTLATSTRPVMVATQAGDGSVPPAQVCAATVPSTISSVASSARRTAPGRGTTRTVSTRTSCRLQARISTRGVGVIRAAGAAIARRWMFWSSPTASMPANIELPP